MLSREDYVRVSLQYNLFWIRVMKEHAVFIEATMSPPGRQYGLRADNFKQNYDRLMLTAIRLANGVIPADVLHSGQFYSEYTEEAEAQAQLDTGIFINRELTRQEYNIVPQNPGFAVTAKLEQDVSMLNQNLLTLTDSFVRFKAELLNLRSSCGLFTMMYTADIEHVLLEARRYQKILTGLQNRNDVAMEDYKTFWTQNMAGHAKVMRGELDPTEVAYFNQANEFANAFDTLANAETGGGAYPADDTLLSETHAIAGFKAETTQGILSCHVQAIMLALYTDHLLREANHFIWMLQNAAVANT